MSGTNGLVLNPKRVLIFNGPANKVVISCLSLTNPTKHAIYFKIQTTAPQHYNAYPQLGVIQPGTTEEIDFERQPADQEAYSDSSLHFFMIQSAYNANDSIPAETFWKTVSSSEIMNSKLQAVFWNNGIESGTTSRPRGQLAGQGEGIQQTLSRFEHDPLSRTIESQPISQDRTSYGLLMIQFVLVAIAILLTGIIVGALL